MPRGNAPQTKVIYKGESDSFVIFVESEQDVETWKKDRSVPLAQVVAGFKIFQTHGYVIPCRLLKPILFFEPPPIIAVECEEECVTIQTVLAFLQQT